MQEHLRHVVAQKANLFILKKNENQCYKISGNKFSELRLTLVDKNISNINNKGTSTYEQK